MLESGPDSAEYAAVAKQTADTKRTKQMARRKPEVCTMPPTKQSRCHFQEVEFVDQTAVKGLPELSKIQTVATFTRVTSEFSTMPRQVFSCFTRFPISSSVRLHGRSPMASSALGRKSSLCQDVQDLPHRHLASGPVLALGGW